MGPLGPAAAAVTAARLLLDRRPGLGTARQGVVDGPSGSGKSTFARMWEEQIRAAAVPVTGVSSDVLATWDDAFDWWSRFDTGVLGGWRAVSRAGSGSPTGHPGPSSGCMARGAAGRRADRRGRLLAAGPGWVVGERAGLA